MYCSCLLVPHQDLLATRLHVSKQHTLQRQREVTRMSAAVPVGLEPDGAAAALAAATDFGAERGMGAQVFAQGRMRNCAQEGGG